MILLSTAQAIAAIYDALHMFFKQRGVLEVHTPLLMSHTVTDPYLTSFSVQTPENICVGYLQTSPEYAMKRLIAKGYGDIYQICKAFRAGDLGRHHQPEFTLLEWYRIGWDHHALMDEVDCLLRTVLCTEPADRITYQSLFMTHTGINPWSTSCDALAAYAEAHNIPAPEGSSKISETTWLQLIMSECIEPILGKQRPCFVYHYPPQQSALAKINTVEGLSVAERFEVYVQGIELANGFHELQDANEQQLRFTQDLKKRAEQGLPQVEMDTYFLQALKEGLPACAGVALGVDRLIMFCMQSTKLDDILHFPTM